ncbi:hypothetical protein OH77DRAFT_1234239 [Trametes cingulata]|nr:hypothetical protein OH77DRAFT_1234239 [Trametes cingulata]
MNSCVIRFYQHRQSYTGTAAAMACRCDGTAYSSAHVRPRREGIGVLREFWQSPHVLLGVRITHALVMLLPTGAHQLLTNTAGWAVSRAYIGVNGCAKSSLTTTHETRCLSVRRGSLASATKAPSRVLDPVRVEGVTRVGAVGFCYGGRPVFNLAFIDEVQCRCGRAPVAPSDTR